jgi:hypothetical protein
LLGIDGKDDLIWESCLANREDIFFWSTTLHPYVPVFHPPTRLPYPRAPQAHKQA